MVRATAVDCLVDRLAFVHPRQEPLGPHTTFKIGGPADVLAFPETAEQLAELVRGCREHDVSIRILGRGANLLIRDRGVEGVVVSLSRLDRMHVHGDEVYAEAGYSFPKLVQQTVWRGLAGLEGLAGIPANVGGAIFMNAGGRLGEVFDVIESVTVMDEGGEVQEVPRHSVPFKYRSSGLEGKIVLAGTFRLRPENPEEIRDIFVDCANRKRATQPLSVPSAGCIFKNPGPKPAGLAIEECGLKGTSEGAAMVSPKHANFIVNRGEARADDVLRLIDRVRETVVRRLGLTLELEVKVW